MPTSSFNTDKDLLLQLSEGNDKAFEALFMKYFPKVKFFIAHLLKSENTAEELSQNIFMKLWEHRKNAIQIESFGGYVYKMSKNAVLNHIKHRQVENTHTIYYNQTQPRGVKDVEEGFLAKELELLILLTVRNMPEQRRKVYEMSRIEGLRNEEIAQRLQLSSKTVENHLNLALREIKKLVSALILFFV